MELSFIKSTKDVRAIQPNVKTYKRALYSPTTCSVDPLRFVMHLKMKSQKKGLNFSLIQNI